MGGASFQESQAVTKDLSIIIPMHNEEDNIDELFNSLLSILSRLQMTYEIICVNDGSSDQTLEKLLHYHKAYRDNKIVNSSRNFGKELALTAGLHYSRGKAVIPINADLQDPPPKMIEDMVARWCHRVSCFPVYALGLLPENWTIHNERILLR